MIVSLMLGSCGKSLDITPDGKISLDEVFNDRIRTEAYLNTVYGFIPEYYARYYERAFLAGITDEAQDAETGNYTTMAGNWINGALSPSNDPTAHTGHDPNANTYVSCWSGIRHANIFLERIEQVTFLTPEIKNRYKGEATLLRAFYYWELIRKFGGMPVFDKPLPNDFDYMSLKRPDFQTTIDFIVQNCDAVIGNPNMPLRITNETEATRFTKAVAYAVKSQALLFNASPLWNPQNDAAKWQAAATAAREALTALTAGGQFGLVNDYESYFHSTTDYSNTPRDKETIYERRSYFGWDIWSIPSRGGNWKLGACPSQELVDAYDMQASGEPAILGYADEDHLQPLVNAASGYDADNPYAGRDPRFYATVYFNGAEFDNINGSIHIVETFVGGRDQLIKSPPNRVNTRTGYYLRKFMNAKLQVGPDQNTSWKKYRLAELYLNLAEAENEANGPAGAYEAINAVRRRVDMPDLPAGLSREQMRERIRRERRVEFAWEEHRFWDVRRWKILDQTDRLVTGMEIQRQGDGSFRYTRFVTERRSAWQDKYRIFPIPITDASIIPDFGASQNPGW